MDEMASRNSEPTATKTSAPKDKNCPFCGQAFTSSSLGRHLDLYIKEKNPKPADGVHDVEAIRKLRGGITRRQARGSIGARKDSTLSTNPRPSTKREGPSQDDELLVENSVPRSGRNAVDSVPIRFHNSTSWEATGIRSDMQQTFSRQVMHGTQLEVRQKLVDAMDTARAAELALRELLGSWRAAKQNVGTHSTPFDFDPLALDFPALTLQCLQPPPTLFSSTQHPTSTSWSVQSPGQREFSALQAFFEDGFRAWKVTCESATTGAGEDAAHPPSGVSQEDGREPIKRVEKVARDLETSVTEHLQSAYAVWDSLPAQKRQEIWILELARGVGRKHTEIENMKEQQHRLKQENAHLKMQIDQLNRLQQPREFQLLSPTTVPIDRDVISHAYEQGAKGARCVGFDMTDRHLDISTLVTRAIERWKNVITSTRVAADGTSASRALTQPIALSSNDDSPSNSQSQSVFREAQQRQQQQQQQQQHQQQQQPHEQQQQHQHQTHRHHHQQQPPTSQQSDLKDKRLSTASTTRPASERSASSTSSTAPPSTEDELSDQDADAEMEDDDNFPMMNASAVKNSHSPLHLPTGLNVPRTQGLAQQQGSTPDMRFMIQTGTGSPIDGRSTMGMNRAMSNMNIAMQGSRLQSGDMALIQQQVRGDTFHMGNGT
ncbi:hypothetical protein E4U13_003167 [Claviceps humidiphila]|uniref:Uncharacterized protein n=1 Tax=Claviceps humidiphila TaxID=1294629 RepID=A0A9P7U138_9HYPO|nr:hypothetical protein E4U13_003167 [Claviceps humidiphila]